MKTCGLALIAASVVLCAPSARAEFTLSGRIVEDGEPVAARLYIESLETQDESRWYLAESAGGRGNAVAYEKRRGASTEVHTALSAHPFQVRLPPGRYRLTVERGKEYHTLEREIDVTADLEVELEIERWTHMAELGWYSGDTHVHGRFADMPTLALAEDLNVSFPLTTWVTDSEDTPLGGNKSKDPVPAGELVVIDDDHIIWPVNTEYEIFTVKGVRYTLGAVFALGHREPLTLAAPPVRPIIEQARAQGAIIDIDKHNWPWSMMLIPVVKPDLFELSNNHIWRTQFQFRDWYREYAFGPFDDIEKDDDGGFTERGWIDFGFRNYYALLNCGFRIMPTAGTAHGVHPVPLGFGRVYVDIAGHQTNRYDKWLENLKAGRSFVTTGPMIDWEIREKEPNELSVYALIGSPLPLVSLEVVVNGNVVAVDPKQHTNREAAVFRVDLVDLPVSISESSWIAIRAFSQTPDGRPRFVHTAPKFFDIPDKPLLPKRDEVAYLLKRVEDEIERHQGVLGEAAMAEYQEAAEHYRGLLELAR